MLTNLIDITKYTMERLAIRVIKGKESIIDEWYEPELVDHLLMRNWFLSVDDIKEVLEKADEDAWKYVYENRTKYATRIRELIEPRDYTPPLKKMKIHVTELTDKMARDMASKETKEREERENVGWNQYVLDNRLERPSMSCDNEAEDLFAKLLSTEVQLEKYLKNRKVKYVAPSMRSSQPMDPKEKEYRDELETIKMELKTAEEYLVKQDELWLSNKKLIWLKSGTVF